MSYRLSEPTCRRIPRDPLAYKTVGNIIRKPILQSKKWNTRSLTHLELISFLFIKNSFGFFFGLLPALFPCSLFVP
jgi:hypothetical protein